jgi:hypothetical protein
MTTGDVSGLENLIVADFLFVFFVLHFLNLFGKSNFFWRVIHILLLNFSIGNLRQHTFVPEWKYIVMFYYTQNYNNVKYIL